ncbi:hypothetical protein BD770DRAFT_331990, partial [Pilaira anomala]
LAQLGIIDLKSDSVLNFLKIYTTEEEYGDIMSFSKIRDVDLTNDAAILIQSIKDISAVSCRNIRNTLYKKGFKQDYDPTNDYDLGITESLVKHFLDLVDSPKTPLNNRSLERSAAVHTSIVVTNQLFLSVNDIVELGWLEREYYRTSKTKWDGVLFKTDDHKVSPGFVEFSGGVNDSTSLEKEKSDILKLYNMMMNVMSGYPPHIKKQMFCIRFYANTMFFEELVQYKDVMFRIEHVSLIIPTTARQIVKFTCEIPKLIAVVKQVEDF